MDPFGVVATVVGLLLTAIGIRVALHIAKRQGAFRQEQLFVSLSIPQLLPLSGSTPIFSRILGPPGARRMGSVYPMIMKAPPCVAINISTCPGKHIFFVPISVSNNGDRTSHDVTLRIVTSANLAAEKVIGLGTIEGIETKRRLIADHGELHISHEIGNIRAHDQVLIGEVFAVDPEEVKMGEWTIRVVLNLAAQSTGAYSSAEIVLFLVRVDSKEALMQRLAYHAKMESHRNTSVLRRMMSLYRAHSGKPSMWIYPSYQEIEGGVYVHNFNRGGDKTEAGLIVPLPFGNFMSI